MKKLKYFSLGKPILVEEFYPSKKPMGWNSLNKERIEFFKDVLTDDEYAFLCEELKKEVSLIKTQTD